jgi:hypothetical protein
VKATTILPILVWSKMHPYQAEIGLNSLITLRLPSPGGQTYQAPRSNSANPVEKRKQDDNPINEINDGEQLGSRR